MVLCARRVKSFEQFTLRLLRRGYSAEKRVESGTRQHVWPFLCDRAAEVLQHGDNSCLLFEQHLRPPVRGALLTKPIRQALVRAVVTQLLMPLVLAAPKAPDSANR